MTQALQNAHQKKNNMQTNTGDQTNGCQVSFPNVFRYVKINETNSYKILLCINIHTVTVYIIYRICMINICSMKKKHLRQLSQSGCFQRKSGHNQAHSQAMVFCFKRQLHSTWPCAGFLEMVVPPKHPKMIISSWKTHGCWVPSF